MFNLSTETGTYIADGVVAHNCTVAFLTPAEYAAAGGSRARMVPSAVVRSLVRLVVPGEFDEHQFRRSLMEVAA